jgi:NADPH-dependent glutamate synthase beta subunit-like oxidoreductase
MEGVAEGVTFLRDLALNRPIKAQGRVAVIGGGNVAVDAARSALRLGATSVELIYRMDREDMPAYEEEVDEAEKEGVRINTLVIPRKIVGENGKVTGIECVRATLGEFDSSGRRKPVVIEGSSFVVPVDMVVAAVGQKPDLSYLNGDGVAVTGSGTVQADKGLATTRPGIFAAGDNVRGPASVVEAIADGKKSAMAIDRYLGGDGVFKSAFRADLIHMVPTYDVEAYQKERPRQASPQVDLSARYKNFNEVVLAYTVKTAVEEARRCLHCYLREEE